MQFLPQHLPVLQHDSSQMHQTVPNSLYGALLMWCHKCQHQLKNETVCSRTMGVNHCGRHLSNPCSYCSHSIPSKTYVYECLLTASVPSNPTCIKDQYLGTFTWLQKAPISFLMSIRSSVHTFSVLISLNQLQCNLMLGTYMQIC